MDGGVGVYWVELELGCSGLGCEPSGLDFKWVALDLVELKWIGIGVELELK